MLREPHYGEEALSDDTSSSANINILRSLWPYISPYKGMLVITVLSVLVAAGTVISLGVGLRYLVDYGFSQSNDQWLQTSLVILLGTVIIMAVASFVRLYSVSWIGERVVADLRRKIFDHLLHMDTSFFENTSLGEIQSRLTTDTILVQVVISTSLPIAFRNLLIITGGVSMLLITSPSLTGVIALLVPFILIPIIILGRRVRRYSRESQDKTAGISTRLDETFSFIRTVRAFCRETYVKTLFDDQVEKTVKTSMTRVKARSWMTSLVMVLVFGGVSTVLWWGGKAVIEGQMTAGQLSSFLFYAVAVAGSAGSLSEIHGDIQRAAGAADRIIEFLSFKSKIKLPDRPIYIDNIQGELFFNHVSFAYPSRPDHQVLDDITLQINPGEMIALVGPSGAGKSTLFNLIMRLYDPSKGQINLDGVDLKDMDPSDFRAEMGLVPQEPALFSTTIETNITFGKLDASFDEIQNAARAAYAEEFIQKLPKGYQTSVGEKGVQLSGGQRQRIAIARAILSDPKILLLDEATSALDTESERKVQAALERLMKDRTTLVIAHRLSTVQKADRIIVMDQGKIVAWGTHGELVRQPGLYQNLAKIQLVG